MKIKILCVKILTVSVLETLFLFGWFRDHFNAFGLEYTNIGSVPIKHFQRQHKMLPFVRIGYKKGFCGAVML